MIERLLRLLLRHQDISHAGSLYLRRFLLTPSIFGWRLMLHKICRPDLDRVLHDHPWDFATLCLRGGYTELVYQPAGVRAESLHAGQVRLRAAEHTHRVDTIWGSAAWTLVLHGRRRNQWGFWKLAPSAANEFIVAQDYFTEGYDKASAPARKWKP